MSGPQINNPSVPGGPEPATQFQPPGAAQMLKPGWRPMVRKAQPVGAQKRVAPGSEPF